MQIAWCEKDVTIACITGDGCGIIRPRFEPKRVALHLSECSGADAKPHLSLVI